jgi:FMN phosphatase YigB (HAD superfamily)
MAYEAVIFDLDDTLLRTYPAKWDQHKEYEDISDKAALLTETSIAR